MDTCRVHHKMQPLTFIAQLLSLILFIWMVLTISPFVSLHETLDLIYEIYHFLSLFLLIYGMCSITLHHTNGIRLLSVWSYFNTLFLITYTVLLHVVQFTPTGGCTTECDERVDMMGLTIMIGIGLSVSHALIMTLYFLVGGGGIRDRRVYVEEHEDMERNSIDYSLPLYEPKEPEPPEYRPFPTSPDSPDGELSIRGDGDGILDIDERMNGEESGSEDEGIDLSIRQSLQ
jgi:hypothetical protein